MEDFSTIQESDSFENFTDTFNLPNQTRKVKTTASNTIKSIQERWTEHKTKTEKLLDQSEIKSRKQTEHFNRLHAEFIDVQTENERLRKLTRRLEAIQNDLKRKSEMANVNSSENLAEKDRLKREVGSLSYKLEKAASENKISNSKLVALEKEKCKLDKDNNLLRRAFCKMENKASQLEAELRETKNELEVFEDMLNSIPKDGNALSKSLSEFERTYLSSTKASADTSFKKVPGLISPACKVSLSKALDKLALQHETSLKECRELAEEAKKIKSRDLEMTRLLKS